MATGLSHWLTRVKRLRLPKPTEHVLAWVSVAGLIAAVVALFPLVHHSNSDLSAVKILVDGRSVIPATSSDAYCEAMQKVSCPTEKFTIEAAKLELRVLNRGDLAAAVTDVGVIVRENVPVDFCSDTGGYEVESANYDLKIPSSAKSGDVFTVPVAQSIPAGATDRFAITLGMSDDSGLGANALKLDIFVLEGERRVEFGSAALLVPPSAADGYRAIRSHPGFLVDPKCVEAFRSDLKGVTESSERVANALTHLLSDLEIIVNQGIEALPTATSEASASGDSPGRTYMATEGWNANLPAYMPQSALVSGNSSLDLEDMIWSAWTQDAAFGSGIGVVLDCQPSCAQSKVQRLPITITLTGPEEVCGKVFFTHLTVQWPAKVPAGFPRSYELFSGPPTCP